MLDVYKHRNRRRHAIHRISSSGIVLILIPKIFELILRCSKGGHSARRDVASTCLSPRNLPKECLYLAS